MNFMSFDGSGAFPEVPYEMKFKIPMQICYTHEGLPGVEKMIGPRARGRARGRVRGERASEGASEGRARGRARGRASEGATE